MQFVKKGQHSSVLSTENGQLDLVLNNEGNVQFTKTSTGLKGEVTIPAAPEVPVAFKDASIENRVITFTKTDNSTSTVELPAVPVDVKLQSLEFTNTGKLKATLSDNSTTEVDFSAEVVVKALESATEPQKARLKAVLLTFLKGEVVQDLAGTTHGYLLPES